MHTRRLYYEDPGRRMFEAEVLKVSQEKDRWALVLDQTAFYPEGGGQPADHGTLRERGDTKEPAPEVHVLDVQEAGEEIIHYVDQPLEPGTKVSGALDWERRFDLTQQHSGEHIVSGLIHNTFGYDNVGFHLGNDVVTIDFNGMLTNGQLALVEERANRIIWENRPTEIFYPSAQELETLDYRSKKELTGDVRIVRFEGADTCACCGTHVVRTGEIGMVRILSAVKFHDGVRLEMIAGGRVLSYLRLIDEQNRRISVKLSAKPDQTAQAVERLAEECFSLRGKLIDASERYFLSEAEKCEGEENVLLIREGLEPESVRKLTDAVLGRCPGRCAVFSRNADGSFHYAVGHRGGDLRAFARQMNYALHGRGGGKPGFIQGSVRAGEEEIRTFFADEAADQRESGALQNDAQQRV